MSFRLRITFTGMCLYVPDGNWAVHVLMPMTADAMDGAPAPVAAAANARRGRGGVRGYGYTASRAYTHAAGWTSAAEVGEAPHAGEMVMEAHSARITFDTAQLTPGRTTLSDVIGQVSLRGRSLEVPRGGDPLYPALPEDLVTFPVGVLPGVFDPAEEAGLLDGRVVLHNGQWTCHDPGACWYWNGSPRCMCHQVGWTIEDYPGDQIEWPLTLLGGGSDGTLGPLYPVNGELNLYVWHAPHYELPPDPVEVNAPEENAPAPHFHALYGILQPTDEVVPLYCCDHGDSEDPPVPCPQKVQRKGASVYTCMGGKV